MKTFGMALTEASPRTGLSRRELRSVTAQAEKRVLVAVARRLPTWIGPDHLTALGGIGMAGAGFCYHLVPLSSWALLGVNVFLFLNWFGDSLDGTLARVREKQRPRYGFYVDHLVDGFGVAFLMAGLADSGLVRPSLAAVGLVAYLLFQLHITLKAHATGTFQIAVGGVGGTELRILMGAANLVLWVLLEAGRPLPAQGLECAFLLGLAALLMTLARDAFVTGRDLDRQERGR
jgi:archaetidylinositol phosphate synthase